MEGLPMFILRLATEVNNLAGCFRKKVWKHELLLNASVVLSCRWTGTMRRSASETSVGNAACSTPSGSSTSWSPNPARSRYEGTPASHLHQLKAEVTSVVFVSGGWGDLVAMESRAHHLQSFANPPQSPEELQRGWNCAAGCQLARSV